MSNSFLRKAGAFADTKELEYISALHQTCLPFTRANGTISVTDVRILLSSRYGLKLTHKEALDVVRGLGGPCTTKQEDNRSLGREKSFFANNSNQGLGNSKNSFSTSDVLEEMNTCESNHREKGKEQQSDLRDAFAFSRSSTSSSADSSANRSTASSTASSTSSSTSSSTTSSGDSSSDGSVSTTRTTRVYDTLILDTKQDQEVTVQEALEVLLEEEENDEEESTQQLLPNDEDDEQSQLGGETVSTGITWGTDHGNSQSNSSMIVSSSKEKGRAKAKQDASSRIEQYLDIAQIVSLLLIPELCESASPYFPQGETSDSDDVDKVLTGRNQPIRNNLLEEAIDIILSDVVDLFHIMDEDVRTGRSGPEINPELIRAILSKYDELELIPDDSLIQEMIDVLQSERLDAKALARALTADVREHWDTDGRNRISSHYYDVFHEDRGLAYTREEGLYKLDGESDLVTKEAVLWSPFNVEEEGRSRRLKPLFNKKNSTNHSNNDSVLDTYSSAAGMVCLWLFFMSLAFYGLSTLEYLPAISCQAHSFFVCAVFKHTARW